MSDIKEVKARLRQEYFGSGQYQLAVDVRTLLADHDRLEAQNAALLKVTGEIKGIMQVYREQEKSRRGVGTPGGLEHMGDVWSLFMKWEKLLEDK